MHDRLPSGVVPVASDFLSGGGGMGALMRAHDWSSSPLGDPSTWPQSLRTAVGMVINSKFPSCLVWGPHLVTLYNDAFRPILGAKPEALGRPFSQVWSEAWDTIGPIAERAFAGEPTFIENFPLVIERNGYPEQTYFTFCYSPVRGETGNVAGFLDTVIETTAQVLGERRQTFRIKLEDILRDLADPRAIMATAVEALGQHLRANRVGYSEVQADGETIVCETCFANGVEPLIGTFSLNNFGSDSIARQRSGQVEVCDDVAANPTQVHATWAAIETRAFVSVPLIRDGHFTASLYANFQEPHRWTPEEVALIEDVAARTWAAVERARAEESLRESEAQFRLMADAVPQIVWITDADGRTEFFNRQWSSYTGVPYEPTAAADIAATYVHPDDGAPTMAAFNEARRTGGTFAVEHRIRSAAGDYRWFLVRAEPYRDPRSGEIVRWFGASVDIHDRKLTEDALRESEQRFRALVTAGSYSIYRMSPDWSEMRVLEGRGFLANTERPSEAWLGSYIHPDDQPHVMAAIQEAIRTKGLFELEHRVRRADGTLGWAHSRAVPILDADGAIIEWFGAASDVTARRQAEEAREGLTRQLAEERTRLETLIESLPVGVGLVDSHGTTLLSNPAFRRYRPDGAISSRLLDDREQWIAYDAQGCRVPKSQYPGARALQGELVTGIEFLHQSLDGRESWTRVSGIPLRDRDGQVSGALSVIVDIDEIKRSEEHQRLLINELNHRVKNTLATVQSIATQTLRNAPTAGEAKNALEGRLLALSRAHDVLTRENWEGAELREIAAQALEPYSHRAEDRLHLRGPKVRLSPRMALALAMVLQELATNAVKYGALSNATGEIRITWRVDGKAPARLHLQWEESGGPPVQAPTRRGFGTRLIERSLAQDLDGEVRIEFASRGVTCTVDAPIA
jgi:PAS domain S-box-containing protein